MIHIFDVNSQSAVKYKCDAGFIIKNKPLSLFFCYNCRKKRRAINLIVKSFYDGDRFFCKNGCEK